MTTTQFTLKEKLCNHNDSFIRVTTASNLRYKELEPLIHYFEHEMQLDSFTAMHGNLFE